MSDLVLTKEVPTINPPAGTVGLYIKPDGTFWRKDGDTLAEVEFLASTEAVPVSRTVNGHALSVDVVLTKADIGLSNVPNADSTNPSNITQDLTHRFVTDAEKVAWNAKEAAISAGTTSQYWRGDKSWQTLDKAAVGLSSVPNLDTSNPANITQDATHRFVSDAEKTTWNSKESAIASGTTAQYWRGDKIWAALDKAAVGLSNVDNTSDLSKPISTPTQTALNAKEPTIVAGTTSQYWRGDKSWQTLDKSAVGLGNVDDTSDVNKPVSTATQTALSLKLNASEKGAASGVCPLDATSKIAAIYLPSFVDDVLEFANLAAFPGTGENAKIYVALDSNKTYRWSGSAYIEISPSPGSTDAVPEGSTNLYFTNIRAAAAAPVQSVAGRTGAVVLAKADVGLGSVDNTSDLSKPISTATQTALNGKEASITAGATSQYWRGDKTWQLLDKTAVGLANVDNTTDLNKPISTATQTALNGKEASIAAGTTAQYWRGDKTWQAHDKASVGLGNVDNTTDLSKPISTATQTALNAKEGSITAGSTAQYWRGDKTWQNLDRLAIGLGNVLNVDTTNPANITQSASFRFVTDTEKTTWNAKQNALGFTPENAASKGAASGYASLTAASKHLASEIPFGSAVSTVCQGNDSRLSDARTPTAHAANHVTGGSDIIPDAVSGGASGLMSGADKAKLDGNVSEVTTIVQSSTSTTYANVTELITPILQPGVYKWEFDALMQTTNTTTGWGIRIGAVTATLSQCFGRWWLGQAADGTTATFQYQQLTATTNVTSTAAATANADAVNTGRGAFTVSVAGTVAIQIRSETGTAVSIRAGAVLKIEKVA
jgi:hypothetical protein